MTNSQWRRRRHTYFLIMRNYLARQHRTILAAFIFCLFSNAIAQYSVPLPKQPEKKGFDFESQTLIESFPKFDIALDSILSQMSSAAREINPSINALIIYKVKVRSLFKEDLRASEAQYLSNYFENKIRVTLSRGRFAILGGNDLKTLSVKVTDSTLQVKNIMTDKQLQDFAKEHNAHGILAVDVMVTPTQLVFFLNLTDVNGFSTWNKEFRASYIYFPPNIPADLESQYALKKKTGLSVGHLNFGFSYTSALGIKGERPQGKVQTIQLGYRWYEMGTIFPDLDFFFDGRLNYAPKIGKTGYMFTPGMSFELFGNESVGPKLFMFDLYGGVYSVSELFTFTYGAGLSLRMSRRLGIGLQLQNLGTTVETTDFVPAGTSYSVIFSFVL